MADPKDMGDISKLNLPSGLYHYKDEKARDHINDTTNPHQVTKAQVGLSDVDNTADSEKSVKYATTAGNGIKSVTAEDGKVTITDDAGNNYESDALYDVATQTANGLMSSTDKTLIDNLKDRLDSLASLDSEFQDLRSNAFVTEDYNTADEDLTTLDGLSAAFVNLRTHMFIEENSSATTTS